MPKFSSPNSEAIDLPKFYPSRISRNTVSVTQRPKLVVLICDHPPNLLQYRCCVNFTSVVISSQINSIVLWLDWRRCCWDMRTGCIAFVGNHPLMLVCNYICKCVTYCATMFVTLVSATVVCCATLCVLMFVNWHDRHTTASTIVSLYGQDHDTMAT